LQVERFQHLDGFAVAGAGEGFAEIGDFENHEPRRSCTSKCAKVKEAAGQFNVVAGMPSPPAPLPHVGEGSVNSLSRLRERAGERGLNHQRRSKRSSSITLFQALTKSCTNFSSESL
jgi:hypothetical protein